MKVRDLKIIQQTLIGISFRAISVIGVFLTMPIMLKRLGSAELGIWLVLLSIFQWITLCDFGVAAGARNEMARAFASCDISRTRQAIATGLIYTVLISTTLGIACIGIGTFTPLIAFLERVSFHGHTTGWALWIVVLGSCAAFSLNYIQLIYAADQKTSAISYFSAALNTFFLGFIYWWPPIVDGKLNQISSLYVISIIAANLSLVLWYFWRRRDIIPNVSDFRPEMRGRILGFGIRIFIIQIAAMVVFTTALALVSSFMKPVDVVVYDTAFKLFSVITMLHGLIMTTFWSSFTEAHALGDWSWIGSRIKLLQLLCIPILLACLVLALASPWIIRHWMSEQQVAPISLYFSFAALTALSCWSNVFAFFLNGVGDTKLQLSTSIIALLVHFPSCYLFTKVLDLGMIGINLGTIISVSFFAISGPIYVWNIINKRALR